jgi:hypothetical protein
VLQLPSPLPKLPDVPEFPLELLPDDLAAWVADAAERARFRPEFAAVPCMAALGILIGRKLGIRLKRHDDWTEYANVWGAIIGPPSALKSPAIREAMRPFKALQVAADARYQEEQEDYETALEGYKLQKGAKRKTAAKALAKNPEAAIDLDCEKPDKPIARTYWTSDATAERLGERLGELLAENPNGLLVERDELSSFLVKLALILHVADDPGPGWRPSMRMIQPPSPRFGRRVCTIWMQGRRAPKRRIRAAGLSHLKREPIETRPNTSNAIATPQKMPFHATAANTVE